MAALDINALQEAFRRLPYFAANTVLVPNSARGRAEWYTMAALAALLDHGTLLGLTDDDHTQYVLADASRDIATSGNTSQEIKSTGANFVATLQLTGRNTSLDRSWFISSRGGSDAPNNRLGFFNNASNERVTFSDAGGLSVNSAVDPGAGIINANSGFRVANAAASGNVLRGDGTNFVSSAIQSGDLPAVSREIPIWVTGARTDGGALYLPNEAAANYVIVWIYVPTTWDGSTNITLTTVWFATSTGNVDLETEIVYHTESDEASQTSVQAFTNTNLSWTTGSRTKILTTTLSSLAAGRHYRVRFQRNTGDANTGDVYLFGVRAVTAVR